MPGAYLLPQNGGAIYFDVVEEETVERDAGITEHPVETGANVVDHYRVKPNTIGLNCFVSQEPIDPSLHPNGNGSFQGAQLVLPQYPAISDISTIVTAVVNPVGTLMRALRQQPTTVTVNALQWATNFDSLADLLGALELLRSNAQLVDVATKSWYYASYLLGPVKTTRAKDTGTGTRVSLTLKQVRLVTTSRVPAPPIPVKPVDKPSVSKGAQQTKDPGQYSSAAAKMVDGAHAFFVGTGALSA